MERTEAMTQGAAPGHDLDRSYIDWPAIIAGAVIAVAVAGLFASFGAALGFTAISAEPGKGSLSVAGILTVLWLVITLVASYWIGGYITGRMRRRVDKASADEVTVRDGINGLVVWGVAIIVGAMLVSNVVSSTVSAAGSVAGTVAQTAGSALGGAAQGALSAAGAAMPDTGMTNPMSFVTDTLLRPASPNPATSNPADIARQASGILANVVSTGEISDADRAYLVSAAAAQTGLTEPEVTARVDSAVKAAQDARAKATELADQAKQTAIDAAETARKGAILTGFLITAASLVAAAASYIGAVRGGRHRDEGRIFGGLAYRR